MLKKILLLIVFLSLTAAGKQSLRKFLHGSKQFAADVYREVSILEENKNFLVCPFSAETIFALIQNGAIGETGEEIRNAFHFSNSSEETNSVFKTLLSKLSRSQKHIKFHSANKIYIRNNYPIKENFSQISNSIYKSDVENINFADSTGAARTINDWVLQQTQNKINDLVDPEILNQDTVAVLVNALYFQGIWKKQFKKTLTHKRYFQNGNNSGFAVDTMKTTDRFHYFESEELDAKFLEMPFKGGRNINIVFALPNDEEGLKRLEEQIGKVYNVKASEDHLVEVQLPKFKIENSIDFKSILKNLGVKKAFANADFSGITEKETYISEAIQKTYISIDEKGGEAAAATAVVFRGKSLNYQMEIRPKEFIANHPFLFYIKIHDVVIFTGRVISP